VGQQARMIALGGEPVALDLSPFLEAARLLYEGPWVRVSTSTVADRPNNGKFQVVRRIAIKMVTTCRNNSFRSGWLIFLIIFCCYKSMC
ncbi:hypothetical protein Q6240_28195, partial [Klebsiella pneumoniae]|nr:hypothetical protein [Klebsiella pneumoniae]